MENCWVTCPRALCTPYCNSSPRNGVKFTTDDSDYTVLFRFFTEFLLFVSHDLHSLNRLKIQCYPCLSAVLCTCLPRKYCEQGMGWWRVREESYVFLLYFNEFTLGVELLDSQTAGLLAILYLKPSFFSFSFLVNFGFLIVIFIFEFDKFGGTQSWLDVLMWVWLKLIEMVSFRKAV